MATDDFGAPRDFPSLRELITIRASDMPRRLMQVAIYALDNPDEIAFGTAASIAAKAEVQPSTLVRFSQALGYQGFSDLQDVFRNRLRDRVLSYEERLTQLKQHGAAASRSGLVLDGFLDAAERSLADLRSKRSAIELDAAVALMAGAECIYLIGLRRSFPITAYMAYAMGKLGIRHVLVDGLAGLGPEQASFITERDVVLAISFTPYASETVALATTAKSRNAKVISITDSPFSPIAPIADVMMEIVEANFEGFRAMAAVMALAMALAVATAAKRGES